MARNITNPQIKSGTRAVAVTPDNSNDLVGGATRGLYVGVAGDVNVDMADGGTVLFVAMAAGIVHPISVKRVRVASTDAESIVAIY